MRTIIHKILVDRALNTDEIRVEMQNIGVDPRGIKIMEDKFRHYIVKLFNLTFQQAAIIKQEMLARGAEAAVSWRVCSWQQSESEGEYEALLSGTMRQFQQLVIKLKQQPLGLPEIAAKIEAALENYSKKNISPIVINNQTIDLNARTYIMGIVNVTPDSFSKDGLYNQANYIDKAIEQANQMVADGADFIDLGAESSRPGSQKISEEEEAKRLLPVLKEMVKAVKIPISVDTYKPVIAEKALNLGAAIINDIWGLKSPEDPERRMAQIVGEAKVPIIIMHNNTQPEYKYLIKEIVESLNDSINIATKYGIDSDQIIIDPGIGFGKKYQDNLRVLQHLDQLKVLGRPILLGTSRKSVIGLTLDLPVEERLEGTIATAVWGIAKGVNIIRVHDVRPVARAVKMCDAIIQEQ